MTDLGLMIACMLMVGFLAQWLAWWARLPAILFLLLAGIVLGPVAGVLDPDELLGELLFPVVSLAVALILFEGSMTLRFSELPGIGRAVRGLVSYGAVVALLLLAAAARYIAGVAWPVALLFGALTCVTGPTVIAPMLRTLRPNARIANTLRWEGIVIDPLGALFAVLIFEAIVSRHEGRTIGVFAVTVASGVACGAAAAWGVAQLLRRRLVPEYLHNYAVLASVLMAFSLSNSLSHESGLLAVTIMGIALGNLRGVHLDEILDFKENLTTLLVSMLFILLAARLQWPLPPGLLGAGLLVFLASQFLIRPITVAISSLGSALSWRERALIGWVAPRGIVAASVSALFAIRLDQLGAADADALAPLVFIIIIGTVVLQSATARPLALWLGVAEPEPRGVLIFGSDKVARAIGKAISEAGFRVVLADDDWEGVRLARMDGLNTYFGNPATAHAERNLDLTGVGRLLALSTHRERNSLACVYYRREFGRDKVHLLRNLAPSEDAGREAIAGNLLAPPLFDEQMTHGRFAELMAADWKIKATKLTPTFDWPRLVERYDSAAVPMFAVGEKGLLHVAATDRKLEPRPGWTVIVLTPPTPAAASEPKRAGDAAP